MLKVKVMIRFKPLKELFKWNQRQRVGFRQHLPKSTSQTSPLTTANPLKTTTIHPKNIRSSQCHSKLQTTTLVLRQTTRRSLVSHHKLRTTSKIRIYPRSKKSLKRSVSHQTRIIWKRLITNSWARSTRSMMARLPLILMESNRMRVLRSKSRSLSLKICA